MLCVSLEPFFIGKKIEDWLWCTSFILKVFILMVFGIETSRLSDLIYDLLGSLALIPIHHTIYLNTEQRRRCCCFNMTSRYEPLEFFKLLFFGSRKLCVPDVWFANVEFVMHFTELKRFECKKIQVTYLKLVFECLLSFLSTLKSTSETVFCRI